MCGKFTQDIKRLFQTLGGLCDDSLLEDREGRGFELEILLSIELDDDEDRLTRSYRLEMQSQVNCRPILKEVRCISSLSIPTHHRLSISSTAIRAMLTSLPTIAGISYEIQPHEYASDQEIVDIIHAYELEYWPSSLRKVSIFKVQEPPATDFTALSYKVASYGISLRYLSLNLEEFRALFCASARVFLEPPVIEDDLETSIWSNLTTLTLSDFCGDNNEQESILCIAARAAQQMPRLRVMELLLHRGIAFDVTWCVEDIALFTFRVEDSNCSVSFRHTCSFQLDENDLHDWRTAASIITGREQHVAFVSEPLRARRNIGDFGYLDQLIYGRWAGSGYNICPDDEDDNSDGEDSEEEELIERELDEENTGADGLDDDHLDDDSLGDDGLDNGLVDEA
ncbi:hypothetical protein HD806DRAFT_550262 [Xylariaceae sp. AK1471]|nr:hypothetical protein HD806DRAFT_550262 [Xylariaceae sp. AK1471]